MDAEFLFKNNTEVSYSCLMMMLPSYLTNTIMMWAQTYLPRDVIDPTEGIEKESHITVLFGLLTDFYPDVIPSLRGIRRITAELGNISVFENDDRPDVLKIDVVSPDLVKLNQTIKHNLKFEENHPGYNPHVTIAYLNKGEGRRFSGSGMFAGHRFSMDRLVFSDSNKVKTVLPLTN